VQTLVLDAEVAIFDDQLRSRFELLRYRRPDVAKRTLMGGSRVADSTSRPYRASRRFRRA
jgi:hypothetical protein